MTKNRPLIVGNWKMNFNMQESSLLLERLSKEVKIRQGMDVVLAPSLFALQSLSLQINRRQFKLAAQNFYWRDMGSFTGEVSIAQLRGIVDYALVGHQIGVICLTKAIVIFELRFRQRFVRELSQFCALVRLLAKRLMVKLVMQLMTS